MSMRISDVVPGDRIRLMDYGEIDLQYKRRLMSFGITAGVEFSVVRVAPLGCPVQIEVRGVSLFLRKEDARQLILERL